MVKNGHPIPGFGFSAESARVPGFEVMDLAEVHRRIPDGRLQRVHRTDFHSFVLITEGSGEHVVDFVSYPCRPGTLLWIRPGQVQRFDQAGRLGGRHLLFTAAFPPEFSAADRLVADWSGVTCWQLGTSRDYATAAGLFAQLAAEYCRPSGTVSSEILQFLLATLMLQIDRLSDPSGDGPRQDARQVYARFRTELERSYLDTRRAEDYAAQLGYTVKTLTRACQEATGQSMKQVIDARVALQAQRLLAHTDDPVAAIARHLGFSEPTNFGKFFTRHSGSTPGEFRRTQRGRVDQ